MPGAGKLVTACFDKPSKHTTGAHQFSASLRTCAALGTSAHRQRAGWLNTLLKYIWPGFISTICNNLAQKQLTTLFDKLSVSLKKQPMFRVAFGSMKLQELSLGCLPPEFDNATVRASCMLLLGHPRCRAAAKQGNTVHDAALCDTVHCACR